MVTFKIEKSLKPKIDFSCQKDKSLLTSKTKFPVYKGVGFWFFLEEFCSVGKEVLCNGA